MAERVRIEAHADHVTREYVSEWDGVEVRAGNPFGLDSRLLNLGAPWGHDLVLVGEDLS